MRKEYEERLYEIKFIEFINKFFKNAHNPTRVYDFIEILCDTLGESYLIMHSATQRCILNEHKIRVRPEEKIILYVLMDYGIRPTAKKLGCNTGSIYYHIKKYESGLIDIEPRFPPKERTAIMSVMKQLSALLHILD